MKNIGVCFLVLAIWSAMIVGFVMQAPDFITGINENLYSGQAYTAQNKQD